MFWIVVVVVVAVGFALAWVTSGRQRPLGRRTEDPRQDQARAQVHRHDLNGPGGGPSPF